MSEQSIPEFETSFFDLSIIISLLVADIADVTYYYRIYYLILAVIAAGAYNVTKEKKISGHIIK